MLNTSFNSRAFRCPAFEPMVPLAATGGVESSYAVGFDGSNDYININTAASIKGLTSYSVSVWAKPKALVSGNVYSIWFESINTDGTTARSRLFFENASGSYNNVANTVGVRFRASDGESATTFSAGANAVSVGLWYHIVFVFDSVNDSHKIYVNGRLRGTSTASVAGHDNTTPASVTIGVAGTSSSEWLNGAVDDLRIYNRALTDAEVQSIHRNSSSPPTSGLIRYLPLDEGTGTTVTDSIGGLTGTLTNGPTWQPQVCPRLRSGRDTTQSWGVSLVGASSHYVVSTSSPLNPSATNFTASAWVKFTGVATQQVILSQLDGSGTGATWLELTSGAKLQTAIGGSNLTGATSLVANVWYHVALQQSGTDSTLYLNGTADGTATRTPASASGVIRIGTSKAGANYMTGNVKSVRIDNAALSAADIAKLANNIPISATPVGHWKLDDGTSTTAIDSSGNGNNGTLTNGPTWSGDIPQWFRATIESSYSLNCDGINDYVQIADNASIDANLTAGMSIVAWFNPTSLPVSTLQMIASKYATGATDSSYYLGVYDSNGDGVAELRGYVVKDAANTNTIQGTIALTAGRWTHAALTHTVGGLTTLYTNAVSSGSITGAGVTSVLNTAIAFNIGARNNGGQPFNGQIDEVAVYSRVLTVAELADSASGYIVSAGLVSRYKLDGNANDTHGLNHGTEQGGVGYSTNVPGAL